MKIIKRLKAFFHRDNKPVELDLVAAEIKEGRAYLHTKGEEPVTYRVRSNDIEIRLNKEASLKETDILLVKQKTSGEKENKLNQTDKKTEKKSTKAGESVQEKTSAVNDRFKKRVFSVSLYPEEYDMLVESVKSYGYKRADFVLACVNTASKGSMEKAHKKILKTHKVMLLEKQALAKKQAEEAVGASQTS